MGVAWFYSDFAPTELLGVLIWPKYKKDDCKKPNDYDEQQINQNARPFDVWIVHRLQDTEYLSTGFPQ